MTGEQIQVLNETDSEIHNGISMLNDDVLAIGYANGEIKTYHIANHSYLDSINTNKVILSLKVIRNDYPFKESTTFYQNYRAIGIILGTMILIVIFYLLFLHFLLFSIHYIEMKFYCIFK